MTDEELYFRQRQAKMDEENRRLNNQQFNYMVDMGSLNPQEEELQRQQATIDALRDKSNEQTQGRMVGNTFVAPSFTQYAAQLGNAYMARKGNEETKKGRADVAAKRAKAVAGFNPNQNQGMYSGMPQGFDPRKYRFEGDV